MTSSTLDEISTKSLDDIVKQGRYSIQGIKGRGTWGIVYSATDTITGERVAIKILEPTEIAKTQMRHRGLSLEDAIMKEIVKFAPAAHIVPRRFEMAEETAYLVMPAIDKTLADVLDDNDARNSVRNKGLNKDDVREYVLGIAKGLLESHGKLRRAHGDLKADNILLDGKVAMLTDFGSATTISMNQSANPRDNIGFLYTRAPELFQEGSRPDELTDTWSWGALVYRMYVGKYPFEDELNQNPDFLRDIEYKKYYKMLDKKVKALPRNARYAVETALKLIPNLRHGIGLVSSVYESSTRKGFVRREPWLAALFAVTTIFGAGAISAVSYEQYQKFQKQTQERIEEAARYPVAAEWNGADLSFTNNLVDLKVKIYNGNGSQLDFPSTKALHVKPGEKYYTSIRLATKALPPDPKFKREYVGTLGGSMYILGYPAKSFGVAPYSEDPGVQMGMFGQGYRGDLPPDLEIPKDIVPGNHFLAVEVYGPRREIKGYAIDNPENAINRVLIPLVVGDIDEKKKVNMNSMAFSPSGYMPHQLGVKKISDNEDGMADIDRNLSYEVSIPELEWKEKYEGRDDNSSNLFRRRMALPDAAGMTQATLQLVVFAAGKPISYSWLPIETYETVLNRADWRPARPDKDFSERIIPYRKKLF